MALQIGEKFKQGIFAGWMLILGVLASGLFFAPTVSAQFMMSYRYPELPFEATTLKQDNLRRTTELPYGPENEEPRLQACTDIINSRPIHPALLRWATFEKMAILVSYNHEEIAIELAREWIESHPDDPGLIDLRYNIFYLIEVKKTAHGI